MEVLPKLLNCSCSDALQGDGRSPQVLQYALLGSDRRQLALEGPATVVFRDSDEQFVVA